MDLNGINIFYDTPEIIQQSLRRILLGWEPLMETLGDRNVALPLHRCQVCYLSAGISSKFQQKADTEIIPIQRVQPLEKKRESSYYCAVVLSPNCLSNHLSKETEGISS